MVGGKGEGVVIHRTFLSHKCFIHVHTTGAGPLLLSEQEASGGSAHELVTLGFEGKATVKHVKRAVKLGDLVSFVVDQAPSVGGLTYAFSSTSKSSLVSPVSWKVKTGRAWDMRQVLKVRHGWGMKQKQKQTEKELFPRNITQLGVPTSGPHGEKLCKLEKALIVATFLVDLVSTDRLKQGSGVYDVAGGSGHLSYALQSFGVPSTVVDPRDTVGCLPRRDRKRLSQLNVDAPACREVRVIRAFFGDNKDVDKEFSGGADCVPVVGASPWRWAEEDAKLRECSAIVALHPDEATEYIVDYALEHAKPFVVVPCCAFYRLREGYSGSGGSVDERMSYVDYLCSKHDGIGRKELGFDGANTVLYFVA